MVPLENVCQRLLNTPFPWALCECRGFVCNWHAIAWTDRDAGVQPLVCVQAWQLW